MERSQQCQCRGHLRSRFVTYPSLCPGRFPVDPRLVPRWFPAGSRTRRRGLAGFRARRPTRHGAAGPRGHGATEPRDHADHADHADHGASAHRSWPTLTFHACGAPGGRFCPVPMHQIRERWAGGASVTGTCGTPHVCATPPPASPPHHLGPPRPSPRLSTPPPPTSPAPRLEPPHVTPRATPHHHLRPPSHQHHRPLPAPASHTSWSPPDRRLAGRPATGARLAAGPTSAPTYSGP